MAEVAGTDAHAGEGPAPCQFGVANVFCRPGIKDRLAGGAAGTPILRNLGGFDGAQFVAQLRVVERTQRVFVQNGDALPDVFLIEPVDVDVVELALIPACPLRKRERMTLAFALNPFDFAP